MLRSITTWLHLPCQPQFVQRVLISAAAHTAKSYYEVLGVQQSAKAGDIKNAFRQVMPSPALETLTLWHVHRAHW